MVTLAKHETVGAPALRYINRLSDHSSSSAAPPTRAKDVLWVPGKNR